MPLSLTSKQATTLMKDAYIEIVKILHDDQVGVRKAMLSGGILFGSGFGLASLGVYTHNISKLFFSSVIQSLLVKRQYTDPLLFCFDIL